MLKRKAKNRKWDGVRGLHLRQKGLLLRWHLTGASEGWKKQDRLGAGAVIEERGNGGLGRAATKMVKILNPECVCVCVCVCVYVCLCVHVFSHSVMSDSLQSRGL